MAAQLVSSTRRLCAGSRRIGDGHRPCGSGAPLGASEHRATGRIPAGCDRRLASPPGGEPTRPSLPSHRYRARRSSSSATYRGAPGKLRAIPPPPSPLALVRARPSTRQPTSPRPRTRTNALNISNGPSYRAFAAGAPPLLVSQRALSPPSSRPLHIPADVGLDLKPALHQPWGENSERPVGKSITLFGFSTA